MIMDEIVLVKRRCRTSNSRTYNRPIIKVEYPQGRFLISQKLATILDVNENDGLMFGFNQKAGKAYVIKDAEEDAFVLRRKDKNSLRFTSKDLLDYFLETFELLESGKSAFFFNVETKPNEKGFYLMTWEK